MPPKKRTSGDLVIVERHLDLDLMFGSIVVGVTDDVGDDFIDGEIELEDELRGQPVRRPKRFDQTRRPGDLLPAIGARDGQRVVAHCCFSATWRERRAVDQT